ncbi:hypothetical protein O77CONTIG1_04690 [Leptolyngbya sp. O-77]|nr:hypothetical protein O77CONTIG1_04690 [Leptolyngbya sp. O-77]
MMSMTCVVLMESIERLGTPLPIYPTQTAAC